MEHPPGKETLAFPNFANNGAKTKTPALMVFMIEYGAKYLSLFFFDIFNISLFSSNSTSLPKTLIKLTKV